MTLANDPDLENDASVHALHFFFRPSNRKLLLALKKDFSSRGVVFQIAPKNVDVLFIYVYLLALLYENTSIIRLSSKLSPLSEKFVKHMFTVLSQPRFSKVMNKSFFVTYERSPDVTSALSSICHLRMVWGHDDTIAEIQKILISPRSLDVSFPDRFSYAILSASEVIKNQNPNEVARLLALDMFQFRQKACSSVRMVIWLGSIEDVAISRTKVWNAMKSLDIKNVYNDTAADVQDRIEMCFRSAPNLVEKTNLESFPLRLKVKELRPELKSLPLGFGAVFEFEIRSLIQLQDWISTKDQTVSLFGIPSEKIPRIKLKDETFPKRFVALGKSNDFDIVWDGKNLATLLTSKKT